MQSTVSDPTDFEAIDVPDMDVLRLGFRGPWRKAADLAHGEARPPVVAHVLSDALAQTMRQKGGCPGLGDLLDAVRTNQGLWDQPHARLQAAELSDNDHVRMAAEVLRSRLAAGKAVGTEPAAAEHAVQDVITRFYDHYFFGRLPTWVGKGPFADLADLERFRNACMKEIDIPGFARRLINHEDGKGFARPPRRLEKWTTKGLLHRPLGDLRRNRRDETT
jgi:hypothetical protein